MKVHVEASASVADLPISLERDGFMRTLARELTSVLSEVIGNEEAAGFLSLVGQTMGRQINQQYLRELHVPSLTPAQVAAVLVDFKRRIDGDFYVIEQDERKIVLGNRACPFAEKVRGLPALCMITSNTFGSITAENLGYAKVRLEETIAEGGPECRVVVHLAITDDEDAVEGREYFKSTQDDP